MSLILDALKKSEQERRRERGPDLQSLHQTPVAPTTGRPWLPWAALALLVVAVNGGALAWWMSRPAGEPVLPITEPHAVAAPVTGPIDVPEAAGDAVPAVPPVPVQPDIAPAPVTAQPPLQELWELPEGVRRQLPALTYSFHVYAGDPSRRTIIINNRRMREGSEIQPGLLLEEITPDGVILATAGHRVHVSVLENW
jgi:general secretion pathway protein B